MHAIAGVLAVLSLAGAVFGLLTGDGGTAALYGVSFLASAALLLMPEPKS